MRAKYTQFHLFSDFFVKTVYGCSRIDTNQVIKQYMQVPTLQLYMKNEFTHTYSVINQVTRKYLKDLQAFQYENAYNFVKIIIAIEAPQSPETENTYTQSLDSDSELDPDNLRIQVITDYLGNSTFVDNHGLVKRFLKSTAKEWFDKMKKC